MASPDENDPVLQFYWTTVLCIRELKEYAPEAKEDEFRTLWIHAIHDFDVVSQDDPAAKQIGSMESKDPRPSEILIQVDKSAVKESNWREDLPEKLFPDAGLETTRSVEALKRREAVASYLAACGKGGDFQVPSEYADLLENIYKGMKDIRPTELRDEIKLSALSGDPPDFSMSQCEEVELIEPHREKQ